MKTIWVFAAGMRRSGSTLQYHLARELIEYAKGVAVGFVTWQKFEEVYNEYDGKYPYVLLKSHVYIPEHVELADRLFKEGRARALYIYRDLRDVAASLLQFGYSKWDHIIKEEIPAILHEDKMWRSKFDNSHGYITCYEDILNDMGIPFELARIEIFFRPEISSDNNSFWEIVNQHTLQSHQELIATQAYNDKGYNSDSLMWSNHIKDGIVGKYKTVLTPEQITQVETLTHDWLRERGYSDIGVNTT